MEKIIDFTDCLRVHAVYGGSDRKFAIIHAGDKYMLKFSDNHAKRSDISTHYVNNTISEYISSHIAQSIGLPAHETLLGLYKDQIVVACKDFRQVNNSINIEFSEYVRAKYDSNDVRRIICLYQIYDTLKDPESILPVDLQEASIQRYWDTFVVDALVGNFDRHVGNWGYLLDGNKISLAPTYDFGSTLFPKISDYGAESFLKSNYEMIKRCLVFPSPALAITKEKVGKVGYYDMLSSNYDENCTEAVLRIVPHINMKKVKEIVDNTPFITDIRKAFYKEILQMRMDLILKRAYLRCRYHEFDSEAYDRLINGHQFADKDLLRFISEREQYQEHFSQNEERLVQLDRLEKNTGIYEPSNTCEINNVIENQRILVEKYGFHSDYIWKCEMASHAPSLLKKPKKKCRKR